MRTASAMEKTIGAFSVMFTCEDCGAASTKGAPGPHLRPPRPIGIVSWNARTSGAQKAWLPTTRVSDSQSRFVEAVSYENDKKRLLPQYHLRMAGSESGSYWPITTALRQRLPPSRRQSFALTAHTPSSWSCSDTLDMAPCSSSTNTLSHRVYRCSIFVRGRVSREIDGLVWKTRCPQFRGRNGRRLQQASPFPTVQYHGRGFGFRWPQDCYRPTSLSTDISHARLTLLFEFGCWASILLTKSLR